MRYCDGLAAVNSVRWVGQLSHPEKADVATLILISLSFAVSGTSKVRMWLCLRKALHALATRCVASPLRKATGGLKTLTASSRVLPRFAFLSGLCWAGPQRGSR